MLTDQRGRLDIVISYHFTIRKQLIIIYAVAGKHFTTPSSGYRPLMK